MEALLAGLAALMVLSLVAGILVKLYSSQRYKSASNGFLGLGPGKTRADSPLDQLITVAVHPLTPKPRRRSSEIRFERLFEIEDADSEAEATSSYGPHSSFDIRPLAMPPGMNTSEHFVMVDLDTPADSPCRPLKSSRSTLSSVPSTAVNASTSSMLSQSSTSINTSIHHFTVTPDQTGCLGVILSSGSEMGSTATPEDGVIVKRLLPGGVGWLSDTLKQGDVILCVNGKSVQGWTTEETVKYINAANAECYDSRREVKFVVRRINRRMTNISSVL